MTKKYRQGPRKKKLKSKKLIAALKKGDTVSYALALPPPAYEDFTIWIGRDPDEPVSFVGQITNIHSEQRGGYQVHTLGRSMAGRTRTYMEHKVTLLLKEGEDISSLMTRTGPLRFTVEPDD